MIAQVSDLDRQYRANAIQERFSLHVFAYCLLIICLMAKGAAPFSPAFTQPQDYLKRPCQKQLLFKYIFLIY